MTVTEIERPETYKDLWITADVSPAQGECAVFAIIDENGYSAERGLTPNHIGGEFLFVCCVVDMFDPPRVIVVADSWEQAYYAFINSEWFADRYLLSESDLATGDWGTAEEPDGVNYTDSGEMYCADTDVRCDGPIDICILTSTGYYS